MSANESRPKAAIEDLAGRLIASDSSLEITRSIAAMNGGLL